MVAGASVFSKGKIKRYHLYVLKLRGINIQFLGYLFRRVSMCFTDQQETKPSRLTVNKTKTTVKKPTAHQACLATPERSTENFPDIRSRAPSLTHHRMMVRDSEETSFDTITSVSALSYIS